jgi:hypothetical protein
VTQQQEQDGSKTQLLFDYKGYCHSTLQIS